MAVEATAQIELPMSATSTDHAQSSISITAKDAGSRLMTSIAQPS
jgi:hypothetical protein